MAMTIMYYGGNDSLKALRSVSIVIGLPFTIVMSFMCTSLYRAVKWEAKEESIIGATRFTTGLWDWTEGFMPTATSRQSPAFMDRLISFGISLVCPAATMHRMHLRLYPQWQAVTYTLVLGLLQFGLILCWCLNVDGNMKPIVTLGWTCFMFMIFFMAATRCHARERYNIYGWLPEDFFSCLTMYPFAASQMGLHAMYVDLPAEGATNGAIKNGADIDVKVNMDADSSILPTAAVARDCC